MVLQVSNFSKRVDNENAPPPSKLTKTTVRSSIHAASRRRRARASGSASSPRYVVEQAKRRSLTKSPSNSIKFDIPTLSVTPPPAEIKDVDMKDPEPLPGASTSVSLPRYLARPDFRDVPEEVLIAIDPELKGTPLGYVHDGLRALGPAMMQVLAGVRADPIKNSLPKELSVIINDLSSDMPTHILAVYSRQPTLPARRRVTLFPIHNLVLASHCANLPNLPPSPTPDCPNSPGATLTLPVVPLCIPAPHIFPQLSAYLYTKRVDHLLSSLLPCPPPSSLDPEDVQRHELLQFANKLVATYTTQALLQHAMMVNGLWRNVCALGIFDDQLWSAMDLAWEAVLTAMAIGTGNIQLMLGA